MHHSLVNKLDWLMGTWMGKNGQGKYSTIRSFAYQEEVDTSRPASNQPVLHLKFSSWFEQLHPSKEKKYAHFEYSFFKLKSDGDYIFLTCTSSHNNGLSIVEEGFYDEQSRTVVLGSVSVGRSSTNKSPAVLKIKRELRFLNENNFSHKIFMSTATNSSLDEHLFIEYEKIK